MTEIEIVRKSNTIFSTMVCPHCGSPLEIERQHDFCMNKDFIGANCHQCAIGKTFTIDSFCDMINENGINCLVRDSVETSKKADNGFFNK